MRAEHGRVCTREELIEYANELAPRHFYGPPAQHQFRDGRHLFSAVEFH